MRNLYYCLLISSFFLAACQRDGQTLPEITDKDLQQAVEIESVLQEEIEKGDIVEALETLGEDGELSERGIVLSRIVARLLKLIMPNHLEKFDRFHPGLSEKQQTFAEYKGVFSGCYQFRVFYPYTDSRVNNVHWASSVLSIPAKSKDNSGSGVVLAPTLDGFTPFIETGLWLKLCRKGIANLTPESLYQKNNDQWEKIHFDPTPAYKSIDEYTLYEDSIKRYENILNINLDILRNFEKLMTDRDQKIEQLNVMSVKPKQVGFWGSSFGAVVGALVVAKDSRIKGAVLTVGGGNLPYVISRSKIALFKNTRRKQMQLLGIKSIDDYENFIARYIESDPLDFAKKSDRNRLHMIVAKKDSSVPTKAQYELLESFGTPNYSRIESGHILALLLTSWLNGAATRRSLDFLSEKLQEDNSPD